MAAGRRVSSEASRTQAVVGDLHHLVGRADRADHRLAGGGVLGLGDEVADDRQGHVGFEERDADLAHHLVDVLLGQHATTGEPVENPCKPIG